MSTYPAAIPTLELREVGDETMVHDAQSGQVHVLNATAGWVLRACDGNRTTTEIAQALSELTSAELSTVERDVEHIVSEFGRLGVATLSADAPGRS